MQTGNILFVISLGLLIAAPLLQGNVPTWAAMLWSLVSNLFLFFLLCCSPSIRQSSYHFLSQNKAIFIALISFHAWLLLQLILDISIDSFASLETLIISASFCWLAFMIAAQCPHKQRQKILLITILASCTFQGIWGVTQLFATTPSLLLFEKIYYLDNATGSFVNPNHYAAYLMIGLIILLSHGLATFSDTHRRIRNTQAPVFLMISEKLMSPALLVFALLLICFAASKSFGAALSLAGVLSLMAVYSLYYYRNQYRQHLTATTCLASAGAIVVTIVLFLSALDIQVFINEYQDLAHTITRRYELSKASAQLTVNHGIFGVGGGAFYSSFPEFRNLSIGNNVYYHAHNDYLEFFSEFGLIGIAALASFLFLTLKQCLHNSQSQSHIGKVCAFSAIFTSVAVGIHSFVDFPLQIPAYASTCLTLLLVSLHPCKLK